MLDSGIAYMLWVLGFMVGFPGFHRLYMKKFNAGTAVRFIPGIGHMIAFFDLFAIPSQIREINLRRKYERKLLRSGSSRAPDHELAELKKPQETVERTLLRTAKNNKGIITAGELALEGNISISEAKKQLDDLAAKGFVEIRVKKSGIVVYTLPEFMDHGEDDQLLDL